MSDLPKPDFAHNMRVIGYSDQGGRPDIDYNAGLFILEFDGR